MECISSLMGLVIGAIIAFPCKSNSRGMNERFRVGIIYIYFMHYGNSDSLNFQGTTSKDCIVSKETSATNADQGDL